MKRSLIALIMLATTLSLTACREYHSRATYFDGAVMVEYYQTRSRNANDSLTMTFYEPGTYKIGFEPTPEKGWRGASHMPDDVTVEFDQVPRVYLINQYILPDYMRVTITHNGRSESHDFQ